MRPHTGFDPPTDDIDYRRRANRDLITAVQIETAEAVELIENIAALEGVDMLYLGPGDLSVALGLACKADQEHVWNVVDRMTAACARHGKIAAGHLGGPDVVVRATRAGMNWLGYGAGIRVFMQGARQHVDDLSRALQS